MSGTWTRPLSTACWRQGSHLIEVVAVACSGSSADFRAVAGTTVVVNHQPDVSLSLSPVNPQSPTGSQVATVTYRFPQTGPTQRFLSLRAWPSGALLGTFSPTQQQGTWQKVVACSSGAQGVVAKGEACGDTFQQDWATLPGCPRPPREQGCGDSQCCLGPGGGSSPGGGGPGLKGRGLGPGAHLYYLAGGAGNPGNPGQAAWSTALGRNWSHDYSERIIPDIGGRAFLITRNATFRKFTDADRDGFYETVSPKDEYRTLTKGPAGWTLRDLDGTVDSFDLAGLWVSTTDRNGNAKTSAYAAGRLAAVSMPDGRRETFSYHPSGKLAAITEIGVGGIESRSWTYTWSGEDLMAIERPDGTGLRFVYGDTRQPGYLTSRVLLGVDDGDPVTPRPERVEAAWAYL